ncbi:MAG: hypothetical protein WAN65_20635, partial [Candidatus Sulfotelmatobacter sp.]
NSLDELKYSIFENSVKSSEINVEPSLETLQTNTAAAAERLGRKSLWFLQQVPLIKNYVGGLGPVWFLSVRETIVCIDDIERRGKGLSVRDVLGLISNLRELKKCKVCLILNDEALDEDKKDFQTYLEKVVDVSLKFAPSPEECARIALTPDSETNTELAECCVALRISNIRLIKRIERSVIRVKPMLQDLDRQVLEQAVRSLALLGWSVYEPNTAPPVDYLQGRKAAQLGAERGKSVPAREAAWNALLDSYGFSGMDEFDLTLLDGIRDGFFDPGRVKKHASALSDQAKAGRLRGSMWNAWAGFHDSFDDNQTEVLNSIYQSFMEGSRYIDPINLSATVALFKELGSPERADEIIKNYVASHSDDFRLFDLGNYPFREDVKDPDVVRAFADKLGMFQETRSAGDVLRSIGRSNGWSREEIAILSAAPVDEYYRMFKGAKGDDLRLILNACLQFDRIANATEEMREISRRARNALTMIGEESSINARRVRKYGIEVAARPDNR